MLCHIFVLSIYDIVHCDLSNRRYVQALNVTLDWLVMISVGPVIQNSYVQALNVTLDWLVIISVGPKWFLKVSFNFPG